MANGLVEYSIEAKPEIKSIFESVGVPTPAFNQLKKNNKQSMDAFKNAIAKAKQSLGNNGASVELKDDYTDINLYLSQDGESGFGIKPNGDIVSVFSSKKVKGRAHHLLEMAISQGGRQLDCFDIYLTKIYEAHGFKPVAKMKWDDEYIPEGWNKENFKDYNNGEPALTAGRRHVVFMAYDPNNDIEKKKKEAEEKYGKKNEIPYIYDYDDGEDAQHMYKWRSPAEREAIYNNMLERYKNAKSTEELKKVFSNSDKPFLRQMDDLNSLSKEQAQSINAEYSKRYLELIKEENPEEYKKNKKYLEKKYNIKSDASIYIDSLIDIIEYIDAKKKEFKESDVNRDEDGKFAKKNSSKNKSNDATSGQTPNDKKDNAVKTVDYYNKDITQKYNSIENETYKDFINENKEKIAKKQADVIHNIMTDFFKDIANDKELENKIKDFTDDELMTFAIYKKTMENKKVFVDNQIQSNPELSMQLISDGEILKNIASFSNHFPDENRFTKEGIASLKKILPLCQTFDKLYRGDGWKIEDVKKLKVGDSFKQPNKNDIDILNLSKSKSIAEEYAREGAKWSSDFVRITHTFENAQGFDNSYFSFFEDDEEVFIDKSEFILGSIEGDNKNGFNLIWYRKK